MLAGAAETAPVLRVLEIGRIVEVHRYGAPPTLAMVTAIVDGRRRRRDVAHVNLIAFEIVGLTYELDVPFEPEPDTSTARVFWIWPAPRWGSAQ
jgi:hypothetical protein